MTRLDVVSDVSTEFSVLASAKVPSMNVPPTAATGAVVGAGGTTAAVVACGAAVAAGALVGCTWLGVGDGPQAASSASNVTSKSKLVFCMNSPPWWGFM